MDQEHPQSQERPSKQNKLADQISAIGAKITRAISNEGGRRGASREGGHEINRNDSESITSTIVELLADDNRSQSRGREGYHFAGRGGLGNIHPSQGLAIEYDFSARGRDREPAAAKVSVTGRGGSGNIRQPSKDTGMHPPIHDISPESSKSRSRSKGPVKFSTGRGGAGNIRWDSSSLPSRSPTDTGTTPASAHPPNH